MKLKQASKNMEKYCNYWVWGNIWWISLHYSSVAFVCHCRRRLSVCPPMDREKRKISPGDKRETPMAGLPSYLYSPAERGMNKRYTQHKTEEELVAWRNMMDWIPRVYRRDFYPRIPIEEASIWFSEQQMLDCSGWSSSSSSAWKCALLFFTVYSWWIGAGYTCYFVLPVLLQ